MVSLCQVFYNEYVEITENCSKLVNATYMPLLHTRHRAGVAIVQDLRIHRLVEVIAVVEIL
jgi:hypothetical protein